MSERDYIVVFGSAARAAAGHAVIPDDIDVMFGGEVSESDAEQAVQEWAQAWAERDPKAPEWLHNLPIDAHRGAAYSYRDVMQVNITTPAGLPAEAVALRGRCNIKFTAVSSLAAACRLAEVDQRRAAEMAATCCPYIGLDGRADGGGYLSDGPEGLANALRHAPDEWLGRGLFPDPRGPESPEGPPSAAGDFLRRLKRIGSRWPKIVAEATREAAGMAGGTGDLRLKLPAPAFVTGIRAASNHGRGRLWLFSNCVSANYGPLDRVWGFDELAETFDLPRVVA